MTEDIIQLLWGNNSRIQITKRNVITLHRDLKRQSKEEQNRQTSSEIISNDPRAVAFGSSQRGLKDAFGAGVIGWRGKRWGYVFDGWTREGSNCQVEEVDGCARACVCVRGRGGV